MMFRVKKMLYALSKFSLIDELLGLLYWAFVIYGIYLIVGAIDTSPVLIMALSFYIVLVVVLYITILKKVSAFFKGSEKGHP
jgi:hypothetical protein